MGELPEEEGREKTSGRVLGEAADCEPAEQSTEHLDEEVGDHEQV
jgi:hypothetical protein